MPPRPRNTNTVEQAPDNDIHEIFKTMRKSFYEGDVIDSSTARGVTRRLSRVSGRQDRGMEPAAASSLARKSITEFDVALVDPRVAHSYLDVPMESEEPEGAGMEGGLHPEDLDLGVISSGAVTLHALHALRTHGGYRASSPGAQLPRTAAAAAAAVIARGVDPLPSPKIHSAPLRTYAAAFAKASSPCAGTAVYPASAPMHDVIAQDHAAGEPAGSGPSGWQSTAISAKSNLHMAGTPARGSSQHGALKTCSSQRTGGVTIAELQQANRRRSHTNAAAVHPGPAYPPTRPEALAVSAPPAPIAEGQTGKPPRKEFFRSIFCCMRVESA